MQCWSIFGGRLSDKNNEIWLQQRQDWCEWDSERLSLEFFYILEPRIILFGDEFIFYIFFICFWNKSTFYCFYCCCCWCWCICNLSETFLSRSHSSFFFGAIIYGQWQRNIYIGYSIQHTDHSREIIMLKMDKNVKLLSVSSSYFIFFFMVYL